MAKKSRIPIIGCSSLIGALLLSAAVTARGQELSKLPYVPTPQIVVDEMIKLAAVAADDFVVDLGSGDGRIVITAAKQYKANGFGVDIDARLVALSNKNAKEAGVADQARFFERDMFKTDIGKASVLMLYVLPDFMAKLRSKVLTELRPGARVVAHDYYMDQWHPDRMITLTVPEKVEANGTDKAYLYLWIVPAMVKGSWRLFFDTGGKTQELSITFDQEYQMLNANAERAGKSMIVEKPTLRGNEISFGLTLAATRYQLAGKVEGDKIEGKAVAGKDTLNWLARKIP
ncbi:MAG TPA: class I SAM-dependent methyltransferase [Candidatus Binatia bacterium]